MPGFVPGVVGKRVGIGSILTPVKWVNQGLKKLAAVIGVVHDNDLVTDYDIRIATAEGIVMVLLLVFGRDSVNGIFTGLWIANGFDRPGLNF